MVFTDACRASALVRIGPRSSANLLLINEHSSSRLGWNFGFRVCYRKLLVD